MLFNWHPCKGVVGRSRRRNQYSAAFNWRPREGAIDYQGRVHDPAGTSTGAPVGGAIREPRGRHPRPAPSTGAPARERCGGQDRDHKTSRPSTGAPARERCGRLWGLRSVSAFNWRPREGAMSPLKPVLVGVSSTGAPRGSDGLPSVAAYRHDPSTGAPARERSDPGQGCDGVERLPSTGTPARERCRPRRPYCASVTPFNWRPRKGAIAGLVPSHGRGPPSFN